jgi:hypothetical protein
MSLKVIVDEDLPRRAVLLLREYGYDAAGIVEQGMGGWKDPQLWIAKQKDERFLVTPIRASVISAYIRPELISAYCCCVPMKMASALSLSCCKKFCTLIAWKTL